MNKGKIIAKRKEGKEKEPFEKVHKSEKEVDKMIMKGRTERNSNQKGTSNEEKRKKRRRNVNSEEKKRKFVAMLQIYFA